MIFMKIRDAHKFSDRVVDILREERIKQGVSQYQIALHCDISKSALSYIEKHERRPTLYDFSHHRQLPEHQTFRPHPPCGKHQMSNI